MFFFNLGLGEFLILFTAASALVTALYLLDRSRRHLVVSTLRFWTSTERPVESTRRRRIKQWGSLLLQLLAILLLLLALSQLRLGSPDQTSLDHILILDTSSWMAARARGDEPLLEEAKKLAVNYVRAVPSSDRVLVLYADALTTPATSFDSDRKKLEAAINRAQPSNAALDLRQAFDFARRLQGRTARRPGEIVFAGAGRTADAAADLNIPPNLRVLPVSASSANVGLRRIGLRRSASESDLWNIYVSLRNYGARPRNVDLGVQFGG
ncbi:MAG: VWA domain-containing protein, partial [Bryobacterales bacterium]|nr:VWA domain-containing protein [Bryobacterales bacterium]